LSNIEDIKISKEIYLPEYEGFDLQIDLSKTTSARGASHLCSEYLYLKTRS